MLTTVDMIVNVYSSTILLLTSTLDGVLNVYILCMYTVHCTTFWLQNLHSNLEGRLLPVKGNDPQLHQFAGALKEQFNKQGTSTGTSALTGIMCPLQITPIAPFI